LVIEGSLFNGREPDEDRWDFDFGRLDSFSGRLWYKPNDEWELQASSGRLKNPEQLEPGNVVRSTVSASWTRKNGAGISSVTAAYGRNNTDHGNRLALFAEGSRHTRMNTIYGRVEAVQAETFVLATGEVPEHGPTGITLPTICPSVVHCVGPIPARDQRDTVLALTVGGVRDILAWRGFEGGLGADVSFYRVPGALQPAYSSHPVSFHVFFRLRPPAGAMGRMWNMRMSQPMAGHNTAMPMNHEQVPRKGF
jgi:hypothetical protein